MRSPYDHSGRCLNKRLEDILQRSFDRKKMVKGGEAFSHKYSKITGIKIGKIGQIGIICYLIRS